MLRLNLKSGEDLMLQVVGIGNKYVFAPCFTLWVVPTCTEYYVCFMDAAWPPALLRCGVLSLSPPLFPSCPKKNGLSHQGRLQERKQAESFLTLLECACKRFLGLARQSTGFKRSRSALQGLPVLISPKVPCVA